MSRLRRTARPAGSPDRRRDLLSLPTDRSRVETAVSLTVILKTPLPAAYTVPTATGSTASANTDSPLRPLLKADQLCPPSVLLKTPALPALAYIVDGDRGSTARAWMDIAGRPEFVGFQLTPASVLLRTPCPVAA